jgi:hypothetical protein
VIPTKRDLQIYRGDDFEFPFRLKDSAGAYIDITGWTILAQVRASADDDVVIVTLTPNIDPDQSAGGNRGMCVLTLTDVQTASLEPSTSDVWDLQTTDTNGKDQTWLAGKVTVVADVSRP